MVKNHCAHWLARLEPMFWVLETLLIRLVWLLETTHLVCCIDFLVSPTHQTDLHKFSDQLLVHDCSALVCFQPSYLP